MNVTILKYNAGNTQSVYYALRRFGVEATITADADLIRASDRLIIPGVGEASSAMQYLNQNNLVSLIKELKQPVLGICLGMQIMCRFSGEGETDCLGIFDQSVKKFDSSIGLKIPHMGWNSVSALKSDLFNGVADGANVYFVHSFYAEKSGDSIAECDYGGAFSAALKKDNFYGVQFHPEKSSVIGERIIKNFIEL